jgi:probable rRNA maturation factor
MTKKMIFISTNHPCLRFSSKEVVKILRFVYRKEKKELPAIAIVFTYNNFIKNINRKFLKHNKTTDVIAFALGNDGGVDDEVYINLDAAKLQACKYKVSYTEEVRRLLIHAALHLLGYRDSTAPRAERMNVRQEMFLELIESKKRQKKN